MTRAPDQPTARPAEQLRADARQNRARLITAATVAFTEKGADAPLEDIARRAGVGIGTLYRHFPNRMALMESVYRDNVEALCAAASDLLKAPSPGEALAQWMRAFLDYAVTKRGLARALMAASGERPSLFSTCHDMITESASALLSRAQAAGAVRSDVELWDLLKLVSGIAMTCEQTPDCDDAMADRLLEIVFRVVEESGDAEDVDDLLGGAELAADRPLDQGPGRLEVRAHAVSEPSGVGWLRATPNSGGSAFTTAASDAGSRPASRSA